MGKQQPGKLLLSRERKGMAENENEVEPEVEPVGQESGQEGSESDEANEEAHEYEGEIAAETGIALTNGAITSPVGRTPLDEANARIDALEAVIVDLRERLYDMVIAGNGAQIDTTQDLLTQSSINDGITRMKAIKDLDLS